MYVLKDGGKYLYQCREKGLTGNVKVILAVATVAAARQLSCGRVHLSALHANAQPNIPGNLKNKLQMFSLTAEY